MDEMIVFNRPYTTGNEHGYIQQAIENLHLSGNGRFTELCTQHLRRETTAPSVLLTHSATGALEMAALLTEAGPGTDVIMPSFTFVSTANAFVLRGATPVFVDVRSDTLNLDPEQVARAVTPRTRAIAPVHYAGVGADMTEICAIAQETGAIVVEDAAQGIGARYKGRPLGSIGELAALSFHETKNIMCGEGGALLVNDERLSDRAEILQEKGTDRRRFARGEVDKYRWVDIGSSFLMSDMNAAFLLAQLEQIDAIMQMRMDVWQTYHGALAPLEQEGFLRRPVVPSECEHNAHLYYVLLGESSWRQRFIERLRSRGIQAVTHYVPLHDSPGGSRFGRSTGDLAVTTDVSERLVRLPLWAGMSGEAVERVVEAVDEAVRQTAMVAR